MSNLEYTIPVPYSAEKMFLLVHNINDYRFFVPYCIDSRILVEHDNELIAKIDISKVGIRQSFITHNIFIKNKKISFNLVKGPFQFFYGYWRFIQIRQTFCNIELSLNFKFNNRIIEKIFRYSYKRNMNDIIIQAFLQRAKKIYNF
ncbi:type II toxin-antitoxin system RatA family toxin [Candidatus Schneideria nysicola]|uniref:type II toxin-antitoxin system RatA family toxin n=1 Tax=Candidatus Schneideria nysicola TaxID=1081631 RepID=UPI001CAA7F18|nr:type II toxin-antitoxin system RatA family toxin [Candidatus Schneideria nysicola]UAJ65357.1 type II toxin-antitoxin system RatA family toxin [Candidatus Schneideria nysicola]UAJ65890.1 type II toxin-antitoxin system RatA family toxin [Candidatus Schneideria nysicola]